MCAPYQSVTIEFETQRNQKELKVSTKTDYRSLRSVLESKTKKDLQQVAVLIYGYEGPKSMDKRAWVDFLVHAIQAEPNRIAYCFPPIDQYVAEALWNAFQWGSARLECPGFNHRNLVRQLEFVGVEQEDDDLIIHMPDEIRAMYRDAQTRRIWEEQRGANDYVDDLAEASVRRYGHTTVNEILALGVRWGRMTKSLEMKQAIKRVLVSRSSMCLGDAQYYLFGDAVLHLSICGTNPRDIARLGPDFIKARDRFPRWMPDSEEEFLEILDGDYYEKNAATNRLLDVLADATQMDDDRTDDYVVALTEAITGGAHLSFGFRLLRAMGFECKESDERRLENAIQDFANHSRLRWLNGHTPAEVGETYKPLPADKVFFADDIDESQLNFPDTLRDEYWDPMFDKLDDEPVDLKPDTKVAEYGTPEPIVRDQPRIGRNDPCPCGSGLKYKKCCGRK